MKASELISLGDKVELKLFQQTQNAQMEGKEEVYKSQVLDRRDNGNYIISMPIQNGRLVLLTLGVRYQITFFGQSGMYQCIGQVIERYKKDNIFMLEIELKTQLERYQRREFFRYSCVIDFKYLVLEKKSVPPEKEIDVTAIMMDEKYRNQWKNGTIVDISGGGMKFKSESPIEKEGYILAAIRLKNEKMDSYLQILCCIIGSNDVIIDKLKIYENRAQFFIKDNKIREEIIRYIFDEERKNRQKEKR